MEIKQKIAEIEKEIEELLSSLDGYGYSREENLKELNESFWDSDIDKDIKVKYLELKATLSATKSTAKLLLDDEIEFLIALKKWRSWEKMSIFAQTNINDRIRILQKQRSEIK